jgi:hypothetical protein
MRSNRYLRRESSPLVEQDHNLIRRTDRDNPIALAPRLCARARLWARVRRRADLRAATILVALEASNARTEGFNCIIKQTKRIACGYGKLDQPPAPYFDPHCSHTTSEINGTTPTQIRRAGLAGSSKKRELLKESSRC